MPSVRFVGPARDPGLPQIATEVAGRVPDDDFCVALAGATKVFVAELVQEGMRSAHSLWAA